MTFKTPVLCWYVARTGLVQRIFNWDKIQDKNVTPDNVLNIYAYGSPFYVIIYTSYEL